MNTDNKYPGPEEDVEKAKKIVFIVILMAILTIATMDLYIPSLPAIMQSFKVSQSAVQWLISSYMVSFSLSHIIYGPLSDHYGRRPTLLFGLGIGVIGSVLIVSASSFSVVILGRLLQGVGFAAGALLSRAILGDCFKNQALAKVGSIIGMATAVTVGLAPSIGGLVQLLGHWKLNFYLILVLTILAIVYVYFKLPETNNKLIPGKINIGSELKHYTHIFCNGKFLVNTVIAGLAFGGMLAYAAIAPFIVQIQLGYDPLQYGLLSVLIAFAQVFGYFLNGKLIMKKGMFISLFFGAFFLFAGALILLVFAILGSINIYTLMLGILLFVFGTGFIYANAYAMAFSLFNSKLGNTAGIYGLVQLGCAFIVSYILTLIPAKTMLTMGMVNFVIAVLIFVLLILQITGKIVAKEAN